MEIEVLIDMVASWFVSSTALAIYRDQEPVRFIYILLFIDVFVMNFLVIRILAIKQLSSHQFLKIEFQRDFLLMELLINFPVTLGVIGTLIAISISASKAQGSNLSTVMTENFDAAIVTTVIGGLVYGYCFLLQALLYRFLNKEIHEKA
uniref:MotA/TolQ/ExbB proton channel family protein n=1 Tax=Candidatus Kentrum sp. UNK TaxID=2126344 RepID=A0A451ATT8_9GAMM|nr:MAG: hypothetical protein BECKUNK1418G_GA0071005_101314 [Candidatus Kentron sp. UNK]VFK69458.1 MAG: hypothetical protein BECKUNK1418H_GA0071006_101414 [Candidatus Kentron sp. UNK]